MNILFYTSFEVDEYKGGTERITATVASGLQQFYGHKCFSAYTVPSDNKIESTLFEETFRVKRNDKEKFREIIRQNKIDCVINQGDFKLQKVLRDIVEETKCKLILVHHFSPGWEEHFIGWNNVKENILSNKVSEKLKGLAKILSYPIFKYRYIRSCQRMYKIGYDNSDYVVLLSKHFKEDFMEYGGILDDKKFYFIPNALSFDDFYDSVDLSSKHKQVIIVSRMDEGQKKLSYALKIWQMVKQDKRSDGWNLKVIGEGPDLNRYKRMALKMHLSDVDFLGKQNPKPYYEESAIFMMTSRSEGWGLTLTEAQQMGVVPLAFNSYRSAVDIINDEENGYLTEPFNLSSYAEKLLSLMDNDNLRNEMAKNAIETSHRFERKNVVEKWNDFLEQIQ